MFRIPGATTELRIDHKRWSDGIGLIVKTNSTPGPVVWRIVSRSGLVLDGRILTIEPADPKWMYLKRRAPSPEIYLVLNLPPPGRVKTNSLSRELEIDDVWPFVDRGAPPVPGTRLYYGFLTVERPRRPNVMLLRDGAVVYGYKIRVVRIDNPVALVDRIENVFDKCKEIALADPDLRHLVSTR
ncbi:hypothetical protein AMAG_08001 [Allomyces macrogynus ATCC 38327]|uniref:Uncharacterized protein n=1 Tax=Allomyces macrogynus (strain ATCC 38327) TaxID=578462 RepID=A0A0L0SK77_ALLM3|nr:hypothetical protein AMAG_08001 [Allomyces macrogynus ATCC 38327]|eukprot:KNE62824.1 hypothetical protein AMAG_08001 [Allomyces macrogynus ATCC 38327]